MTATGSVTITGSTFLMSNHFKLILTFVMHYSAYWMVLSISYLLTMFTDKLIADILANDVFAHYL
jgi:hypothetical protein